MNECLSGGKHILNPLGNFCIYCGMTKEGIDKQEKNPTDEQIIESALQAYNEILTAGVNSVLYFEGRKFRRVE